MLKNNHLPIETVRRMPRYFRYLECLQKEGIEKISSKDFSARTGITASTIRQDLRHFGAFGYQGYGYNVDELLNEIAGILGMKNNYHAVVIGAGPLAHAILANFPFQKYGITVTAIYDTDPIPLHTTISGIPVYPIKKLNDHFALYPADFCMLTVSDDSNYELIRALFKHNIKGILNFTHTEFTFKTTDSVIENFHFFDSFFHLCCTINTSTTSKTPPHSSSNTSPNQQPLKSKEF